MLLRNVSVAFRLTYSLLGAKSMMSTKVWLFKQVIRSIIIYGVSLFAGGAKLQIS